MEKITVEFTREELEILCSTFSTFNRSVSVMMNGLAGVGVKTIESTRVELEKKIGEIDLKLAQGLNPKYPNQKGSIYQILGKK